MLTRADRIFSILEQNNNRLKVSEIVTLLQKEEQIDELHPSTVSSTVRQDNQTRDAKGEIPRFNHSGDGSEGHGYISIRIKKDIKINKDISGDYENSVPEIIEQSNEDVKNKLKTAISDLTWQEFESNFLERILESLGFSEIRLTQKTRDGGKDAECEYKRGLVESKCIVSAKHWKNKTVGLEEVQRLRGLKGDADTGIIVTSNSFSKDAIEEAKPSQNQRSIVLIDASIIVDVCFKNEIGVEKKPLPSFYTFKGLNNE